MIDSYWDLYVAYVNKCVRDNWINDIDPHHYEMEWNHFLPQCIFGDQPIGQWLTLRQHAIASALQTLAFRQNCMFGWHKQHLLERLLELAWPPYCKAAKKAREKSNEKRDESGRSVNAVKGGKAVHEEKNEDGKSVRGVETAKRTNSQIWESTIDGFRSNPGNVAQYNRARGWDPNARKRVG